MRKQLFSLTLDVELKKELYNFSKKNNWSMSQVIEKALIAYIGKKEVKKKVVEEPKMTEEERLADWEFRKKMVAEGKFAKGMELEYPDTTYGDDKNTDIFAFEN